MNTSTLKERSETPGFSDRVKPLLLLSISAAFLSEVLIWNVRTLRAAAERGLVNALLLGLGTWLLYFMLLSMFADISVRFRVKSFTGLALLGSIYGLVLEGIFADMFFLPGGLGPCIGGVCLVNAAWPALNWHALIDFSFCFYLFRIMLSKESWLRKPGVRMFEGIAVPAFAVYWFIWCRAPWQLKWHEGGIPYTLLYTEMLCAMAVFGLIAFYILKGGVKPVSGRILGKGFYIPVTIILVLFAWKRLVVSGAARFIIYCLFILFYTVLFLLFQKYEKNQASSLYERSLIPARGFSWKKYLSLCLMAALTFFAFHASTLIRINGVIPLDLIYKGLCLAVVFLMLLFSLFFPLYVLFKIAANISQAG